MYWSSLRTITAVAAEPMKNSFPFHVWRARRHDDIWSIDMTVVSTLQIVTYRIMWIMELTICNRILSKFPIAHFQNPTISIKALNRIEHDISLKVKKTILIINWDLTFNKENLMSFQECSNYHNQIKIGRRCWLYNRCSSHLIIWYFFIISNVNYNN